MSMITELVERLRKNSASLEITFSIAENLREAADVIEELSAKLQAANMERSSQYEIVVWMPLSKPYEPQESEKINCKTTKCENCKNHNYCDYEPKESEKRYGSVFR